MDNPAIGTAKPLTPGYELESYTIKSVLGKGGFGITYLALDNRLDREVAIKEYLPTSFANRHDDDSINPISDNHTDSFSWGLDNFLKEAKTLARFNHQSIVRVHTVFEYNNSAYMVMEYEQGRDLASILRNQGSLDQQALKDIFLPIIDGLGKIHELGFIHRDVKPANIYIRANGSAVLIDFGSARQTSLQASAEFTTLISQGYTPPEQYSADYGNQGAWTDLYALAATMYHCITGDKPDDSLSRAACALRSQPDRVQPLLSHNYPGFDQPLLNAVTTGLALAPESRPQSLASWQRMFDTDATRVLTSSAIEKTAEYPSAASDSKTQFQPQPTAPDPLPAATGPADFDWDSGAPDHSEVHQQDVSLNSYNRPADRPAARTAANGSKGGLVAGLLLLAVAVAGGAFYFMTNQQGNNTDAPVASIATNDTTAITNGASSTVNDTSTPAATATTAGSPPANTSEPAPATTTPANALVFFDRPLTSDTHQPPRSIEQLVKTTPMAPPFPGLDEAMWKDQNCSNCHAWTKESLCKQGQFYVSNDAQAIKRTAHPFNGLLKSALKEWANNDCS